MVVCTPNPSDKYFGIDWGLYSWGHKTINYFFLINYIKIGGLLMLNYIGGLILLSMFGYVMYIER